ncbi:MAG TPA: hypothetical protein V6C57_00305 [Coleofasciculaceae cyanobacterium]
MARIKPFRMGFIALGGLALLTVGLPLWGQSLPPLPTPEEAIRQADQVDPAALPEKLVSLTIDEETRDRLRFDPAWQPMRQAIQQDIMILKWGDSKLQHPVWQQYGAKSYPLLAYYASSADPTRQAYGLLGIRSLGRPYTTLWLEQQLQRHTTGNFYLVTVSQSELLTPYSADPSQPANWKQEFGLEDAATRDRLIRIARQNLEPETSPDYYEQFNLAFLSELLGYEAVYPSRPSPADPQPAPPVPEWDQLEKLTQLTEVQRQQAITYYRNQLPEVQQYLLVTRLGQAKAGAVSAAGKAVLQDLMADPQAADRLWAIAELDRHGDPKASALLETILNGDLKPLYPLTRIVSYEGRFSDARSLDRATHAYYLLLGMAEKYPQSQFVQAAREYGNLTGRSYFGGSPRSPIIQQQNARKTPAQRIAAWQDWLKRYASHPGADDATYFLARAYQDNHQVMAALDLWVKLMTDSIGDDDASYLAWGHVRSLLDVGLSSAQLEAWLKAHATSAIAPLFQYALAVHYARDQRYAQALQVSEGLDLTTLPKSVLGSYYTKIYWWNATDPAALQQQMQSMLTEQRQRWQHLQQLQAQNTPAARYQIAADWAGAGGWKNGYLDLWTEDRHFLLPTGDWSDDYCQYYWICNVSERGAEAVRSSYQQSSQNAIALSLFQPLIDDAHPAPLREKALYMAASTALWQWEDHPLGETFRIHPLAGMQTSLAAPSSSGEVDYSARQAQYQQLEQDYLGYLDSTIAALKQQFPHSQYIDDLLFSRYAMSGKPEYLQEIVDQYGAGDRAAEARFLLAQPPRSRTEP